MKENCFWESIMIAEQKCQKQGPACDQSNLRAGLRICTSLVWFQQSLCQVSRDAGKNNAILAWLQISDLQPSFWTAVTNYLWHTYLAFQESVLLSLAVCRQNWMWPVICVLCVIYFLCLAKAQNPSCARPETFFCSRGYSSSNWIRAIVT